MSQGDDIFPSGNSLSPAGLMLRLKRYGAALVRWSWMVALLVCVGALGMQYYAQHKEVMYLSQSKIIFNPDLKVPGLETAARNLSEEMSMAFGTEVELLGSSLMRQRTLARISKEHPELGAAEVELKVTPLPYSSVIALKCTGPSQGFTQTFLDALMKEYIASKSEVESEASKQTLAALTQQLGSTEQQLSLDEEALSQFRRSNNVVFLEEQGSSASRYLVQLNAEVANLKTEHQLLGSLDFEQNFALNQRQKKGDSGTRSVDSELDYLKAQQEVELLKAELVDLGQYLRPAHPKIILLREKIDRQEKMLGVFRTQTVNQLSARKESLRLQIENLEKAISDWQSKALAASQGMSEFERLQARANRTKALYERLIGAMQTLNLGRQFKQDRITVLEQASVPVRLTRPGAYPIFGGVLGLVMGLVVVWILDRLDDRFESLSELHDRLPEEILGQIPRLKLQQNQRPVLGRTLSENHAYQEAFRNLRSALIFLAGKGRELPKLTLVCSSIPGEGKSTVAANLAITLAGSGTKVLLVDADLRKGTQQECFGLPEGKGFTEVLRQEKAWRDVVRPSGFSNLEIITSGSGTGDGADLFLGSVANVFLSEVRHAYDHVIIDTAPLLATDDTSSLVSRVDGVLFVIRPRLTPLRAVSACLEQIRKRQGRVLGVVVNGMSTDRSSYGYGAYRFTGYEYHKPRTAASSTANK